MSDATSTNSSEFPVAEIPEAQKAAAMRLGISFNGIQFVYRDFKYDRLHDAVAYAELDILREGRQPVPSGPSEWLERPIPSSADQALMRQYGICLEDGRFRYRDYRYDRLDDALNYARHLDGAPVRHRG